MGHRPTKLFNEVHKLYCYITTHTRSIKYLVGVVMYQENITRKGGMIMTQMGLEYMKHKETGRHNVEDENIRNRQTDVSAREADTHQYIASFKPQEVAISQQQADASTSQAGTAAGRLGLDKMYRERETMAKEGLTRAASDQAQAALSQANTAFERYVLDLDMRERETLAKEMLAAAARDQALTAQDRVNVEKFAQAVKHLDTATAASEASRVLGFDSGGQYGNAFLALLDRVLPNLNFSSR